VGEGLYNFGELLEHPVVATLEATHFAWLAHLLRAFSAGDIDQCADSQISRTPKHALTPPKHPHLLRTFSAGDIDQCAYARPTCPADTSMPREHQHARQPRSPHPAHLLRVFSAGTLTNVTSAHTNPHHALPAPRSRSPAPCFTHLGCYWA
jgi:hypothetical protein